MTTSDAGIHMDSLKPEGPAVNLEQDGIMLRKVISGGQTGVDRAGLDAALAVGLEIGGWCPRGRRAEDGQVPSWYPMQETASDSYPARTRMNVRDADVTIICFRGTMGRGTRRTLLCCEELGRPYLVVAVDRTNADSAAIVAREILRKTEGRMAVLNVAGSRESGDPGVYAASQPFLERVFLGLVGQLQVAASR
jgi:hypothetical protein